MESSSTKIAVIVAVVIAVLGVGGWLLMRDDNKDTKSNTTSQTQTKDMNESEATPNIVGVASADEQFSTLVTAVKAAGLVETLSGEGPFTVFAPTNEAFNKLPAGTVEGLLKPESLETLKGILTYHVVAGKVMSSELTNGQEITTVQGGKLVVTIANGEVTLTDAKGGVSKIAKADVAASNGVVHVIDTVVMP